MKKELHIFDEVLVFIKIIFLTQLYVFFLVGIKTISYAYILVFISALLLLIILSIKYLEQEALYNN